mgnify:CR=1 FL=1
MAIITISRGCCSRGQIIAQAVARELNYTCQDREILVDASQLFDVSEKKLIKSLHDAPGIIERIKGGKTKYLKMIQSVLLAHASEDNLVYSGHAGHLLLPPVRHLLKVRINVDLEARIQFVQEQKGWNRTRALEFIKNEDQHRENWTRYLYNQDLNDPALYDMVLHIDHLSLDDVVEIICSTALRKSFQATPESRQTIMDHAVKAQVELALDEICEAEVSAREGQVSIRVLSPRIRKTNFITPKLQDHLDLTYRDELQQEILEVTREIPGVKGIVCDIDHLSYA